MLFNVLYTMQVVSALLTLMGLVYILRREASSSQKYVLIMFVCFLACNMGGISRIEAKSFYELRSAEKLINFSSAYIFLLYTFFVFQYIQKFMPRWIYWIMGAESTFVALSSTLLLETGVYNSASNFRFVDGIPTVDTQFGPVFYIDVIFWLIVLLYTIFLLVKAGKLCSDASEKSRLNLLIYTIICGIAAMIVRYVVFRNFFDVLPLILGIVTVLLVCLIELYSLIMVDTTGYEQVISKLSGVIFLFNEAMELQYMNEAAMEAYPDLSGFIRKQFPEKYEFLVKNTDDCLIFAHNKIHYERRFTPLFIRGTLWGYSLELIDVTRVHKAMVRAHELNKQVDSANETKKNLLANISHAVRTPMNAIVGYSDLLAGEVQNDEGREHAKALKGSANSLLHIINDILDFSKLRQGELEIVEEEYETVKLFAEVEDIIKLQADKKGLTLIKSVDPTTPAVLFGDKIRLRQILLNIAGNAVKYTNEGSVRIISEWEPAANNRALLTVTVSDTGIGIAKDNVNRLFEGFETLDKSGQLSKAGTGLGLTISKALIERMNGTVSIESEYGVGTSVIIKITQRIINSTPISKTEESSSGAGESKYDTRPIAPDAKILVVDDNMVNLELMKQYLKQFRIIPTLSERGAEAVELASNNHYDIIFMDQMMPEMDGVEAMKRIRALSGYTKDMPIVAVTANALVGTRKALMDEGFTDYASKPLSLKALEEMLIKYLPKGTFTLSAHVNDAGDTGENQSEESLDGRLDLPEYIDQRIGITNSGGDLEQYKSVITIVNKYAEEKIARIRELLEAKDYDAYTIEVHSLKSNASTVGAMRLSDRARLLEKAGKEGDIDTVIRDSAGFLDAYAEFANALSKCLGQDSSASDSVSSEPEPEGMPMNAADEEYMQTFSEIEEAIESERYDDAKDLFEVLSFFELPPVIAHSVKVMRDYAQHGEWQSILDIIQQLR